MFFSPLFGKDKEWNREKIDLRIGGKTRIKGIKYPKGKPVPTRKRKKKAVEEAAQIQKATARHNDISKDLKEIRKLLADGKTKEALKRIDQLEKKRDQKFAETIKKLEEKRDRIAEILKKQGKSLPKSKDITEKKTKKEHDDDKDDD